MLHHAFETMTYGSWKDQQSASNYISQWEKAHNSLLIGVGMLNSNLPTNTQFLLLCSISHMISESWFQYERENLEQIKSKLISFLFDWDINLERIVINKLEEVVGLIAFYEWPENWSSLIQLLEKVLENEVGRKNESNAKIRVFGILEQFLSKMQQPLKISLKRKAIVRQKFTEQISGILNYMTEFQDNKDVVESFVGFSKEFFGVIYEDFETTCKFSHFFFDTFIQDSRYTQIAVKVMKNLLSVTKMFSLIPNIYNLIESSFVQVSSFEFHEFLCDFLKSILETIPSFCSSQENVLKVQKLYETTLINASRKQFSLSFWVLWNETFKSFLEIKDLFDALFSQMLPLIFSTFCELLPISCILSRFISPFTPSAILQLYKIAPNNVISFINSMPSSLSLCYIIGIIKHESFIDKLFQILNECNIQNANIDIVSAVLFSLSRNNKLIQNNPCLFKSYKELFSHYLTYLDEPDYQTTVLLSLNHIASTNPSLISDDKNFVDFLFDNANPSLFTEENYHRLCRILSKIILSISSQYRQTYIDKISYIAKSFLNSSEINQILIGSQIIFSLSSIPSCGLYLITKNFWMPLLEAMKKSKELPCFSDLVIVFASSMRGAPWGTCRKACNKFLKLVQSVESNDEAIVDAFNCLSQCHYELLDYRDMISSIFIQRMSENLSPPFFEFFSITGLKDNEEQCVIPLACSSLSNPSLELSKSSIKMLKSVIRKKKNISFLNNWESLIIQAIFFGLFDDLHLSLIKKYTNVLKIIYKKHLKTNTLSDSIDRIVINSICDFIGDIEVSSNFAITLRQITINCKLDEFIEIITDFLISSGRFNPEERRLLNENLIQKIITKEFVVNEEEFSLPNEDEYINSLQ